MSSYINSISVVVELDINNENIPFQIVEGFAQIERQDLRVAQAICSSDTKKFITKVCEMNGSSDTNLWGADYIINNSMTFSKIILIGEASTNNVL